MIFPCLPRVHQPITTHRRTNSRPPRPNKKDRKRAKKPVPGRTATAVARNRFKRTEVEQRRKRIRDVLVDNYCC